MSFLLNVVIGSTVPEQSSTRLDAIQERNLLFNKRNMGRNEESWVIICKGKAIAMMGTVRPVQPKLIGR